MAQKGVLTTTEYLPLEEFMRLVEGLHKDKKYLWEIFCRLSYWGALRVSDVLKQTWGDILDKNVFVVYEGKTGKSRHIPFGNTVTEYFSTMHKLLDKPDKSSLIFLSPRTNRAYTSQYINELLNPSSKFPESLQQKCLLKALLVTMKRRSADHYDFMIKVMPMETERIKSVYDIFQDI